jgi:hypothetical protein
MSWARLLKRVFDIDVERCPNCGGALKIIAAIEGSSPIWACLPASSFSLRTGEYLSAR